jgi:hypothetical protein
MGKLTKVQKDNKEINKNSGDRSRLEHPGKTITKQDHNGMSNLQS